MYRSKTISIYVVSATTFGWFGGACSKEKKGNLLDFGVVMTTLSTKASASYYPKHSKPTRGVLATSSDGILIRYSLPSIQEDADCDEAFSSNITIFQIQQCYCHSCVNSATDVQVDTKRKAMRPPSRYARKPQMGWASAIGKNLNEST